MEDRRPYKIRVGMATSILGDPPIVVIQASTDVSELTPAQARALAAALVEQADRCDQAEVGLLITRREEES